MNNQDNQIQRILQEFNSLYILMDNLQHFSEMDINPDKFLGLKRRIELSFCDINEVIYKMLDSYPLSALSNDLARFFIFYFENKEKEYRATVDSIEARSHSHSGCSLGRKIHLIDSHGKEYILKVAKQSTNLKLNGNEIWEYDIIKFKDDIGIVNYGEYRPSLQNNNNSIGFYIEWLDNEKLRKDLVFWIEEHGDLMQPLGKSISILGNMTDICDVTFLRYDKETKEMIKKRFM